MPLAPRDRAAAEAACPDIYIGRSRRKWVKAVEEYVEAYDVTVSDAISDLTRLLHTPTPRRGNL